MSPLGRWPRASIAIHFQLSDNAAVFTTAFRLAAQKSTMVKTRPRPAVNGVASADRVLTVLSSFQVGDTALSLVELVERTSLIKSTIMRLMVSLETNGFVNRLADGRYMLASEVMRLNAVYQDALDLERCYDRIGRSWLARCTTPSTVRWPALDEPGLCESAGSAKGWES